MFTASPKNSTRPSSDPEKSSQILSTSLPQSDEYRPRLSEPLRLADLVLYPDRYEAYRGEEKVKLRRKEYQLLEFLMRHQHRVINRHTLLEYIWNYHSDSLTNTLDVHISSLRKKIDGKRPQKMLHTIHGAGYKLSDR